MLREVIKNNSRTCQTLKDSIVPRINVKVFVMELRTDLGLILTNYRKLLRKGIQEKFDPKFWYVCHIFGSSCLGKFWKKISFKSQERYPCRFCFSKSLSCRIYLRLFYWEYSEMLKITLFKNTFWKLALW